MTNPLAPTRLYDSDVEIDPSAVRGFFRQRAQRTATAEPLTSVMYQDQHPDIARQRDEHEKRVLLPLLDLDGSQTVLDIGCGIGRWASTLEERCAAYTGVDFDAGLLEYARGEYRGSTTRFIEAAAQDVSPVLLGGCFDRLLMGGVLLYLNDAHVDTALAGMAACAEPACTIVFREPIATQHRLTLRDHWSEELGAHYSAVYRTADQLRASMHTHLGSAGFTLRHEADLLPAHLSNRVETTQRVFVWSR